MKKRLLAPLLLICASASLAKTTASTVSLASLEEQKIAFQSNLNDLVGSYERQKTELLFDFVGKLSPLYARAQKQGDLKGLIHLYEEQRNALRGDLVLSNSPSAVEEEDAATKEPEKENKADEKTDEKPSDASAAESTPDALRSAKRRLIEDLIVLKKKTDSKKSILARQYLADLADIRNQFVKTGNFHAAVLVQDEINRVKPIANLPRFKPKSAMTGFK